MDIRVGAIGRTISTLSPSGYVDFEGMRRPAKSEGAYIPVGTAVIVLSGNAFGLVVRELEPGTAPPTIAPVGESIGKAEHQLTGADVAAIEREQQWREGVELRHRMKVGSAIAGFLGIVVGLASAAIGSHFNWDNVNDSIGQSLLFGVSAIACLVGGIALYFATGWLAPQVYPHENRTFNADFIGIGMGLLGGLVGFWLRFGEAPETVAMWSVGLTCAFAGVGCGISWLLSLAADL